jgi:protein-tyrosine phosphatase
MGYRRIIFVGQTGTSREPMAAGIFKDFNPNSSVEVMSRGLVVQFPEPMNQKAEAVLISNGISIDGFVSSQLVEEELTKDTLVLTMESGQRDRILEQYENADPKNIHVLTEYVGDELEIVNPYGGDLSVYGLCYETLRKSIRKLVRMLEDKIEEKGEME